MDSFVGSIVLISLILLDKSQLGITSSYINVCSIQDVTLDCNNRNQTSVPDLKDLPDSITFLDFSHNNIKNVIFNISDTNKVERISFAHNKMVSFEHQVFRNIEELLHLDLSYNNIKGSPLNDEGLHLSMFHIQQLILRGNDLGSLEDYSFSMTEFPDLEYLDISYCGLRKVEELSLVNLMRLQFLNLSHNFLTTFDFPIGETEIIDLSFNRIQKLKKIKASVSLKTLYMDYNGMEHIKDGAFAGLLGLEFLSLVGNNLRTLQPNTLPLFSISTELKEIRLNKNPWYCDCEMRWLLNTRRDTDRFTNFSLICVHPSRLRGKNIFKTSESELTCSYEYSRLIFMLIMFFAASLMAAAVGFLIYSKRHYFKCSKDKRGDYIAVYKNDDGDENTSVTITSADDQSLMNNEEQEPTAVEDNGQNRQVHYFNV